MAIKALTLLPEKLPAYERDTWYLESYEQLDSFTGAAAEFAYDHALLLIKPDAIVARAVEPTLMWLADNGFAVRAARRLHVDRNLVRALWYFQWNIASAERRHLADLLLRVCDSIVLVVADTTDPGVPASVRLTDAKGPTDPRARIPGQLRHLLGRYTYLLNMVHTPDDPADVIRELGIYFDCATRAEVLADSLDLVDRSEQVLAIARDLYGDTPARGFERADAEEALVEQLGIRPDGKDEWVRVLAAALERGEPLDPWSVLVVGSAVLPMRMGDAGPALGTVTMERWREHR